MISADFEQEFALSGAHGKQSSRARSNWWLQFNEADGLLVVISSNTTLGLDWTGSSLTCYHLTSLQLEDFGNQLRR